MLYLSEKPGLFKKTCIFLKKISKTLTLELKSKRFSNQNSIGFVCYSISYLMVKSDLKKRIPSKKVIAKIANRLQKFF
jgi:hypothetical protein